MALPLTDQRDTTEAAQPLRAYVDALISAAERVAEATGVSLKALSRRELGNGDTLDRLRRGGGNLMAVFRLAQFVHRCGVVVDWPERRGLVCQDRLLSSPSNPKGPECSAGNAGTALILHSNSEEATT